MKNQPAFSWNFTCRTAALIVAGSAFTPFAFAQYTTPHVISTAGDVTTTLGGTTFVNHGLQGVGRIPAAALDSFGESFGSASGLQITNWAASGGGSYTGTFNVLPDRGYNNGNFYSAYAARIQTVDFSFTPYTGAANIGGGDTAGRIAAQSQIAFTSGIGGVKFTYNDPVSGTNVPTTGLDPGAGTQTIFGKTMPYVVSYTGAQTPGGNDEVFAGISRLTLDSEALVLKSDGSGYVGDEYGANIYHFNSSKVIDSVITPPAALQPHTPATTLNFNSINSPSNGRRNNQGMEGVSLSPDGTRLFALLQSGAVQDSSGGNQNRLDTRLLIYDVTGSPTPGAPMAEYALKLPTYTQNGGGGSVNATAAQSEIVALDNTRFLVLSRDGNGQGGSASNPSVFKSILLVDISVGSPTDFAGTLRDAEGGKITTSSGVLVPAITPLSWTEAVNMLNSTQLGKFNIALDSGTGQVSNLTLGEKWEGMSLVPANDPSNPNDYFLFVANDNDFLTSDGSMIGPDGSMVSYDAFSDYASNRQPLGAGIGNTNNNDTTFLAYRVTITPPAVAPVPEPAAFGMLIPVAAGIIAIARRRRAAAK